LSCSERLTLRGSVLFKRRQNADRQLRAATALDEVDEAVKIEAAVICGASRERFGESRANQL
jgi:hypothetical protein